jgi:hypothetical protein
MTKIDKNKRLILIELNELNFFIIKKYINNLNINIPNFKKILKFKYISTKSEVEYDLLEPWIQWPSVHTGLSQKEHGVFFLGDIINCNKKQIFEVIEDMGYSVGCISPMNTVNNLKKQVYFIPDPWTNTQTGNNPFKLNILHKIIKQAVNDNSGNKIYIKNIALLVYFTLIFVPLKNYFLLITIILKSYKYKWYRSLFLDLLLVSIHSKLIKFYKPNFSTLFLNAGAHIQHHYLFNSKALKDANKNPEWYINNKEDPIQDMLITYDKFIGEILKHQEYEFIFTTGLSQVAYEGNKFYYRIKNHDEFIRNLNINYKEINPCMTRDFIILFNSNNELISCINILSNLKILRDDNNIFTVEQVNDKELFVTLSYPFEIYPDDIIEVNNNIVNLFQNVNFVALKNGMHCSEGYNFFSETIEKYAPIENTHVKNLYHTIYNYFR